MDSISIEKTIRPITAGLVVGGVEAFYAVSLGTLLVSGIAEPPLALGIGILLVTGMISVIITGLFTPTPGQVSGVQDVPILLLAVMIASDQPTNTSNLITTIVATISFSTVLTGIFFFLLGYFHLTGLARYIPYPVIGGFLAGTGWLILQGSITTMLGTDLQSDILSELIKIEYLRLWFPGILFGLVLFGSLQRFQHFLIFPGIIVAAVMLFYIVLFVGQVSIEDAKSWNLLLGNIGGNVEWNPLNFDVLSEADWQSIFGKIGNVGSILGLSVINLLLSLSGISVLLHDDIDVDAELRLSGLTNVLSGFAGGTIGFHGVSFTKLNDRLGGRGRLSTTVAGLVCLFVLVAGSSLISFIPRAVLGGLLFFVGLDFLNQWVLQGYRQFVLGDYATILIILVVIAIVGFLQGVAVGLIITVTVFVVKYSQVSIFHRATSGTELKSNVERNPRFAHALEKLRGHIHILELEGFLFFGTANRLLDNVRKRLDSTSELPLKFVVLDFKRVHALDASVVLSFSRVMHLAQTNHFTVVITGLHDNIEQQARFVTELGYPDNLEIVQDLDRGLEWCEDQILMTEGVTRQHIASVLPLQLRDMGFNKAYTQKLRTYLETIQCKPNEVLIKQGDEASDIYFIEIGQVSVILELDNGQHIRLRTMGMGTIVGELSFYLGQTRSASVISDMNSIVHRLSRNALDQMKNEDPEIAIAFNELMLLIMAERLANTNKALAVSS